MSSWSGAAWPRLARLAEHHEAAGDLAKACEVAWRTVDLAPWQEESHRRLMRLLALSGQRSAALTQFETCRSVLKRELGVEPAAETTRLYEQIRDGVIESGGMGERESGRVGSERVWLSPTPPLPHSPALKSAHLPDAVRRPRGTWWPRCATSFRRPIAGC